MNWLIDVFQYLIDFFYGLFLSIIELVKDVVYFIFNLLLDIVDAIVLGAISLFDPVDVSQYLTGFPPEASWVLGQIGLPQALGMIVTAIGVRIMLQLIPFTRLGS
ncbi:DUF2523 domain-containing protein [Vibrio sinensis]|uniref:DUF2523 domain-containing protein n=1 Tax=Vibrio sinensis TaxID=2302434 RepID=A0A3A6QVB5_9VIBR|nr:DUF2523 family protein [Vibrio sinensis]RJX72807.1 DUF2523 domain-containing protein [Vibrio sinensis]